MTINQVIRILDPATTAEELANVSNTTVVCTAVKRW